MTEEQMRDLLARVVPEAPDSVADPAPVVRAARRQRRLATTVVAGAAALVVLGSVLGVQALRDDDAPDFVDQPAQISDPYAALPCGADDQPWDDGALPNLDGVVAVRHCTRPSDEGFPTAVGPADALVVDLDAFAETVREIPAADPARCAAVSVAPVENQALFQFATGEVIGVRTGSCDDVEIEGRVVDGNSLLQALLAALGDQRDAYDYTTSLPAPEVDWCGTHRGMSPAAPASEHLVAATWCGPNSPKKGGVVLDAATVARLDAAWRSAEPSDPDDLIDCGDFAGGSGELILARTDRGDVVTLTDQGCDKLGFSPPTSDTGLGVSGGTLSLDFSIEDLAAGYWSE
jgi:hypothetical protein